MTYKNPIRVGEYRGRYQHKRAYVVKFSKINVWFQADGKRFVYPRAKFELDFVEHEE